VVSKLLPGDLDHVFFTNSGSESVDTALKIALAYHRVSGQPTRTRLIGRERGYHGVGFGGSSVGSIVNNRRSFCSMLTGIDHLPHTYCREHQAFSRGQPEWGGNFADEFGGAVLVSKTIHEAFMHRPEYSIELAHGIQHRSRCMDARWKSFF
jgi:beta-alanine--pyruvate transaminase